MTSLTSLSGSVRANAMEIPPRKPAQVRIVISLEFALFFFWGGGRVANKWYPGRVNVSLGG